MHERSVHWVEDDAALARNFAWAKCSTAGMRGPAHQVRLDCDPTRPPRCGARVECSESVAVPTSDLGRREIISDLWCPHDEDLVHHRGLTGLGQGVRPRRAARGDKVAATARNEADLADLAEVFGDSVLPLTLDVTDREQVHSVVAEAIDHFGRLDVVVNNAGYGLFGAVEEMTPQELQDQLDVNLFGVLHVTQAVLPTLRAQGAGHIVQISTMGGMVAFPGLGGYHASKWALEGLTEALSQEAAPFGIKVTLVEPSGYATDWGGSSAKHTSPLPQYDALRAERAERRKTVQPNLIGDPQAAGAALLDVVDAAEPPTRVLFGVMANNIVPSIVAKRLETWKEWEPLALKANGHGA